MTGSITVEMATGVFDDPSTEGLPRTFKLNQNYPNPFNANTVITYVLAKEGHTTLQMFDVLGRLVTTLVDDVQPAGDHVVSWSGRDVSGTLVPSGMYFYRLTANRTIQTRKMILLR
jgi:hypothetical protein